MILFCSDLEGVFVPEIWINVAEKTGIAELRLTTRHNPLARTTTHDCLKPHVMAPPTSRHFRTGSSSTGPAEPPPGRVDGGCRSAHERSRTGVNGAPISNNCFQLSDLQRIPIA